MQIRDARRSARDVAESQLGLHRHEDDDDIETLVDDELFAAYAHLHEQAGIYEGEVGTTAASSEMVEAAKEANASTYTVLRLRAEELLDRSLPTEGER
jgi:stress response protein YsnF